MDNREFPTIDVQKMNPKLYKAAMEGDMKVLTSIVEANEPPAPNLTFCLTPQRNTLLHIAVEYGHQNIVDKVIQLCPSLISQHNSKGDTPLHMAARTGHLDLTKLLTPALNLNLTEGNPALEEGNPVWQAGGVALRMRNLEGSSPIHEALKKSHEEVALHLLEFEKGHHELACEVNMAGESLLYLAAEAGLERVVQKIIDRGDYNTHGPDGQNPLHIAVIKGRSGVVKILLDKERRFIPQADRFGNTVLHYASAKTYSWVLGKDKDEEHHWSQVFCQIQILELLLTANPSLAYVPNKNGDYPLFIAVRKYFEWAIDAILDHCPDSVELVNQKGQNALHLAVMEKNRQIIYWLAKRLEFKKLINEPNNDGNTPMHLVTLTNQKEMVEPLIRGGPADLTMCNKEGLTPMDICGYMEKEIGSSTSAFSSAASHDMLHSIDSSSIVATNTIKNTQPIRDRLREFGAVPGRHRWQEPFPIPRTPRKPPPPPVPVKRVKISPEFKKYGLQTLPIVTSLVATVTFAAAFTVPGAYKNDGPREGLPVFMRNAALQAFMLSDIVAFWSSMAATILLVYANARSEDAFKIYWTLQTCYYISGVAIVATITAFLTAVWVLTSKEKESRWLAVTSLLLGFVVLLFLFYYRRFLEKQKWKLSNTARYTFGRSTRSNPRPNICPRRDKSNNFCKFDLGCV